MPAKPEPQGVARVEKRIKSIESIPVGDVYLGNACLAWGMDILAANKFADEINAQLAPLLSAADRMAEVLDDIDYVLVNIWALDRKKFETQFLPRIKEALAAYRRERGTK